MVGTGRQIAGHHDAGLGGESVESTKQERGRGKSPPPAQRPESLGAVATLRPACTVPLAPGDPSAHSARLRSPYQAGHYAPAHSGDITPNIPAARG